MKKSFKLISLACALSVLTGCALTDTQVPLNYSPTATGISLHSRNTLHVGQIQDSRGENPALLAHKINAYNDTMSGRFLADQSISEVLRTAIEHSLSDDGLRVASHGNVTLSGNLLSLDMKPIMGFFAGDLKCKMQVSFRLTNNSTGAQTWSDVLTGTSTVKNIQIEDGDNMRLAFNQAADNLIQQLESNDGFRRAVNR